MADAWPDTAELQGVTYNCYVTLIAITILVFDYILTFPEEVERFWVVRRLNWATCLFFTNRYLVIIGHVPVLIQSFLGNYFPAKLKVCRALQTYHEFFSPMVQGVVAAMLIMRMFALYRRNIRVLAFFLIMSSILFGVGSWFGFGGKKETNKDILVYVGCGTVMSQYRGIRIALSWASNLIFDALVFGFTLHKNLTLPQPERNNTDVLTVLMRDGAMYFGVLTAATLVNVVCLLLDQPLTKDIALILTNVLASVLMSRLMLNLRDPSLISARERTLTEDMNFTYVESHHPTQLSDVRGFLDDDCSRVSGHPSFGYLEDPHRTAVDEIELHRIDV